MHARHFRPIIIPAIFLALVGLTARPSLAHEFWIEPQEYQVQSGAPLVAELRNGQGFSGVSLAYLDKRFQRFDLIQAGQTAPVQGRMGDVPALQTTAPGDGLLVIVHQTTPKLLTYATWEKFAKFAAHKGFVNIKTRHRARDLPDVKFTETYTRYAKTLIGVGGAKGRDAPTGLETEFVALSNPYIDNLTKGMLVQLLYQGTPRAKAQIEVFDRAPDKEVTISLHITNTNGRAVIPVQAGHTYLFDAVVLRESPTSAKAVWETLWAALTFAVPE